jgi:twitching motility two-component system response regulator PilH
MDARKVLVVEDSATDLHYLSDVLAKGGYRVILANSGEEALVKVKSERPDLVLMDVVMPGMSGFQAVRQITRDDETKHIPVIICTSKKQESDRVWGMRQGARDYLTKPISAALLLQKVGAFA